MRFRKGSIESDLVVPIDQSDPKVRRDEVLRSSILSGFDVFSFDDLGDVFGDGRVRSFSIRILSAGCDMTGEADEGLPIPFLSISPTKSASVR